MMSWKDRLAQHINEGGKRDLASLLELARQHVLTPEERSAQRRSWVVGSMLLDHPELEREYVERIYDQIEAHV